MELTRPPASELAIYSTYVDVGGFLEGHDNFYQEDLDATSLAGSLAGGGYAMVAGDMNISTPARRDFQPVGSKMKMKFRE